MMPFDARLPAGNTVPSRWVRHPLAIAAATIVVAAGIITALPGLPPSGRQESTAAEPPAKKAKAPPKKDKPSEEGRADSSEDSETAKPGELPHPFPRRSPAPDLDGGIEWTNVAGPLDLKQLRGKFVLLDFWTYCCINCMHILPELKKLEAAYPGQVVVIGVHSAKFLGEKDSKNITEAVMRYEIQHPVVNDANHEIWSRFGINSWPSLRVIDPEGNLVAGHSGEIDFDTLKGFFETALPYYRQRGLLDETPLRFDLAAFQSEQTPLRYPGKVLADEAGKRLFIADSNHNRIVVASLDGKLLHAIGSGKVGNADGDFANAQFDHPQGMAIHGQTLYVADTENHLLRKIDLDSKQVVTIAGTGAQHRGMWPGLTLESKELPKRFVGVPGETGLNSPWDLWIHNDALYIAMAGPHQIWKMPLDESEIGPFAGNGREDIVDGPLLPRQPYQEGYSSFAQPSGLSSNGDDLLFVADSEGSSIRAVPFDPKGVATTVVGTSHLADGRLFEFGDKDGVNNDVLLQHCLGVAYHRGLLYVTDTYNNKIKVVDPADRSSRTLVGTGQPGAQDDPAEFDEPAGISAAGNMLYVADTNNHAIRTIDLAEGNRVATLTIEGLEPPAAPVQQEVEHPEAETSPIELPRTAIRPVEQSLRIKFRLELPPGYKINPLAPLRYRIEAAGDGPVDRQAIGAPTKIEPPSTEFEIAAPLSQSSGSDELQVTLTYYYCQVGGEGLCKAARTIWKVPVDLEEQAEATSIQLTASPE